MKGDPQGEIVNVTPEMAEEWLARRYQNRTIYESKVLQYAEDMEAGRWKLTHQGIAFNPEGQLVDGQHRLTAITLARRPIRMMVTRGVRNEDLEAVDIGKVRNVVDAMAISKGEKIDPKRAAVAAGILMFRPGARKSISPDALYDAMQRWKDGLDFCSPLLRARRGIFSRALGAVFVRAYYATNDRQRLLSVMNALIVGIPEDAHADRLVVRLRDYLMSPQGKHEINGTALVGYGKIARAVKALLDREDIDRLVIPSKEVFPFKGEEVVAPQRGTVGKLAASRKKAGAIGGKHAAAKGLFGAAAAGARR